MSWISRPNAVYGNGFGRPCTLMCPPGYDPSVSYPLVLLIPVYGEQGSSIPGQMDMSLLPQFDNGAFYFAPTGTLDAYGQPYWKFFEDPTVANSDGDYCINGLVKPALADGWNIDKKKVFAGGMSNGGLFVNRLCLFYSDVIRAMGSVSGPTSPDNAPIDPPQTPIAHTVPAFVYASSVDNTVLFAGSVNGSTLPGGLSGHGYQGQVDCATTHNAWNAGAGTLQAPYDTIRFTVLPAGNNCSRMQYNLLGSTALVERWDAIASGGHPTHTDTLTLVAGNGELMYKWWLDHHNNF